MSEYQIDVEHGIYCDTYLGTPQQLLEAGLVTAENLAILDAGKRSLRLFPDGRPWLGKTSFPSECKEEGGKLIEPASKKRLRVCIWVSHDEHEKRWALLEQERKVIRDRKEQAQQRAQLEEAIQAMTDLAKERIQHAQSELDLPDDQLVAQRRRKLRDDIANWESDRRSMVDKLKAKLQALGPGEAQLPPRLRLVYSDRRLAS